jgi:hypothetical protein
MMLGGNYHGSLPRAIRRTGGIAARRSIHDLRAVYALETLGINE